MAFKQKPVVNARLEQLSKAELVRTVKTLRKRETRLLNEIAVLKTAADLSTTLLNSMEDVGVVHVRQVPVATVQKFREAYQGHAVVAYPWDTNSEELRNGLPNPFKGSK